MAPPQNREKTLMTDMLSQEEFATLDDTAFCNWWQAWYAQKLDGPNPCSTEELAAHTATVREVFRQRWGAKGGDYMLFRLVTMYS
jgi:hypothetical protein